MQSLTGLGTFAETPSAVFRGTIRCWKGALHSGASRPISCPLFCKRLLAKPHAVEETLVNAEPKDERRDN